MKKQVPNKAKLQSDKVSAPKLEILYIIILLAYALIPVITPNMETLDTSGPKFLSLALLNLISFLFLLSKKELRAEPELFWSFFLNKIGLVYTLFMGVILISFTKAINIPESILSFSKYFTVFCVAYILSILLRSDKRYFRILVIVMVLVLISDSLTVFYNIFLYVSKQVESIYEIKSVYSNKNMLAAAVFVKIPFALWLATFEKGRLRKLGFIALFCAELSVFFMSTRAFYVGLVFLVLIYGVYLFIVYMRKINETGFKPISLFLGTLLIAFLLFSFTQYFLYPKKNDIYNKSYTERISTIAAGESGRLDSWKRSAVLFKQDPILGVGTGNWKIRVLKYENPPKSDFTFMVKAHNDFIEVATETGVLGGLLFISLFVLLLLNFIYAFFRTGVQGSSFIYLFLPAFGIFCYSFDAFFNFPADRPELQSLFAIFIGSGIAFSSGFIKKPEKTGFLWFNKIFSIIAILFVLASSYVLLLNFKSLKLQLIAHEDLLAGELRHASSVFNSFPSIPSVTDLLEPIAVQKSRYLINEGKYQDAINLLQADNSSPYMGEREVFLALAYSKIGDMDSFFVYANKARVLKPHYFAMLGSICEVLEARGEWEKAQKLLEDFTSYEKLSPDAWLSLISIYRGNENFQKAIQSIDTAVRYLPGDSSIVQLHRELSVYAGISANQQMFTTAMKYYNQQKFTEALKYLEDIDSKKQGITIVYARRAVCYYYAKEYQKCIDDVTRSIKGGYDNPEMLNIRGVCYHVQGRIDEACSDFHAAAARSYKAAIENEQLLCKGKK